MDKKDKYQKNDTKNVDKVNMNEQNTKGDGKMELEAVKEKCIISEEPKEELSIEEMQKYLYLDNIKPIAMNSTDEKDKQEKGDCFDEWYAEELKDIYKKTK